MSEPVRRRRRPLRTHVTYANVMATLAVFMGLGGGAYAATTLPPNSVGKAQIKTHAVTRVKIANGAVSQGKIARVTVGKNQIKTHAVSRVKIANGAVSTDKLARGAVTYNRLSKDVRSRFGRSGAVGPQGAVGAQGAPGVQGVPGAAGARGPAGADGAGARRVHYDAAATTAPAFVTALDMPGLLLQGSCTASGGDVNLDFQVETPAASVLQNSFIIDFGADPANAPQPGSSSILTGNNQFSLAASVETDLGGPGTNGQGYFRVMARALIVGQDSTITLDLLELVNATTGRCTVDGTALPSS